MQALHIDESLSLSLPPHDALPVVNKNKFSSRCLRFVPLVSLVVVLIIGIVLISLYETSMWSPSSSPSESAVNPNNANANANANTNVNQPHTSSSSSSSSSAHPYPYHLSSSSSSSSSSGLPYNKTSSSPTTTTTTTTTTTAPITTTRPTTPTAPTPTIVATTTTTTTPTSTPSPTATTAATTTATTTTAAATTTTAATTTATTGQPTASTASQPSGAVFWQSQPVNIGETVSVTGGPWSDTDHLLVQLVSLPSVSSSASLTGVLPFPPSLSDSAVAGLGLASTSCTIIQQTNYSISFILSTNTNNSNTGNNNSLVFAYQIWRLPSASSLSSLSSPLSSQLLLANGAQKITNWKLLNTPDIWFLQGDMAASASPGGWIALFGTSMMFTQSTSTPVLALVNVATNQTYTLSMSTDPDRISTRWGVYFDVPSSLSVGRYSLFLHCGFGSVWGWSRYSISLGTSQLTSINVAYQRNSVNNAVWNNKNVIDVSKLKGQNDDARVAAAILNVTRSGGGILYFPAKTYFLNSSIILPPYAQILGDGPSLTILNFTSASYPYNLISATNFAIEAVTIYVSLIYLPASKSCSVTAINRQSGSDYSEIKNVIIQTGTSAELAAQPACNNPTYATRLKTGVNVAGSNNLGISSLLITDVYKGLFIAGNANNTRCTSCQFNYRDANIELACGQNLVIDGKRGLKYFLGNATINGLDYVGWQPGVLFGEYCPTSVTRHVYYANQYSDSQMHTWNDNTNADGKEGWYYGGIVSLPTPTTLLLSSPLMVPVFSSAALPAPNTTDFTLAYGSIVQIVGGRGMGQMRVLANVKYDATQPVVTIDTPWDVNPDQTSFIAITKYKGRFLLVSNNFTSEGLHQSGWQSTNEVIYADNSVGATFLDPSDGTYYYPGLGVTTKTETTTPTQMTYAAGFRFGNSSFPGFLCGAWYSSVMNNVGVTNSIGWTINLQNAPASNSAIWSGHVMIGAVVRNNRMLSPYSLPFTINVSPYSGNVLIENNVGLSSLSWRQTSSVGHPASIMMIVRGQHQPIKNITLTCFNGIRCGLGKYSADVTTDCQRACGGPVQLFQ